MSPEGSLGALAGVRVIDFSRLAPGPMATMILADLGAEVTKVEEPGGGRRARDEAAIAGAGRLTGTPQDARWRAISPLERNKRSIAIDLKTPGGRRVAERLVATADVLVEGFRPGVMERLGLDYARVESTNPRIVYCSITGYGQSGRRAQTVGHDLNYLAYAGALSLIGASDGTPVIPINVIADYAAGSLQAVVGILAALLARARTGAGQHVDVSMTDGVLGLLSVEVARLIHSGEVPRAGATALTGAAAYYQLYETRDKRHLAVACNEPHFFRELCDVLDLPDLPARQFVDAQGQANNREALAHRIRSRTLAELLTAFADRDVPIAPVLGLDEVIADGGFAERGMLVDVDSPVHGRVTQVGSAVRLSRTPAAMRHAARAPGADTESVLRDLGYADREIASLLDGGAVSGPKTRPPAGSTPTVPAP